MGSSGSMLMLQEHWARRKGNPGWTMVLPLPRSATLGKSPCSLGHRCLSVSCGRWSGCQLWALLALSMFSWKQDSLTTPPLPGACARVERVRCSFQLPEHQVCLPASGSSTSPHLGRRGMVISKWNCPLPFLFR